MEMWKYSPVLQSDIRKHEKHEQEIIKAANTVLKTVHSLHVINSIEDIFAVFNEIREHDTFGYITGLDTATGIEMKMIDMNVKKYIETRIELCSRCNAEELTLKDIQEKEDRVLVQLSSIGQDVRSIKETTSAMDKERLSGTSGDGMKPAELAPEKNPPPVIKAVLDAGLLETSPVNGKYLKKGDKKDKEIIVWVFDNSGYGDDLTADLYMEWIYTNCKSTTIQDYISRK